MRSRAPRDATRETVAGHSGSTYNPSQERFQAMKNRIIGAAVAATLAVLVVGCDDSDDSNVRYHPDSDTIRIAEQPAPEPTSTPEPVDQPANEVAIFAQPVESSPTPEPEPEPTRTQTQTRTEAPPPAPEPKTVTLSPVTAFFDQDVVDEDKLVTWTDSPCNIVGHDYAGWAFLAHIPIGTTVEVTTGPCAGSYEVVGHRWQGEKGTPIPDWFSNYDLILQSCVPDGLGFSTAMRVD